MKKLTDELREEVREPFGEVFDLSTVIERVKSKTGMLVSVGDECSIGFLKAGIRPEVMVYDFKIKRKEIDEESKRLLESIEGKKSTVPNEPSTIDPLMEAAVKRGLRGKTNKIFVEGEEDMAALVALMHAADGTLIAYGQPDEGIVLIESNEKMRNKARAVYRKMMDV
ncbi:hypothetical protein DRN67_03070 [Candidatus Micrarchaeota archaeon]|nr:MAG: hypothetical protein DRN67_03070 [Candidatus Micrarchaeota archaeon]